MSTTITSMVTKFGIPTIGLTPTIRIWEINSTGNNILIIGSPDGIGNPGSGVGTDGIMTEVINSGGSSHDGFYSFEFTNSMGFSQSKQYLIRVDGGLSLPMNEQYQTASITPTSDIVNAILDEPIINHTALGSVGANLNQNQADTQQLLLSIVDVQALVRLLIKYDTNRTKIDAQQYTMTVYDDDCTTPLRTFKLLDSNGVPSVTDVCERKPQALGTSDNRPTCI